ncbi:MAG: sugar phosphate isomerase/epimerase family protein [Bryobacteraceae bacterium]|jgi:sugar phosphate isomerase/epimerase
MPRSPVAAITDEFSPDLETAARAMASLGMTGAELRMVSDKNIIDLTDQEVDRATAVLHGYGLAIVSIASPVFKCVLPDAPEVDTRFQQDMFAAQHTFADQPRQARRALEIAARTGARIVRVFSFWRTVRPEACFDRIAEALAGLAELAAPAGVTIGIENEHACNIGTASEAARLLARVPHTNLQLIWDPANALVAGETPFPDGYAKLPVSRIAHVHVKDCRVAGHTPEWLELGTGSIDWTGQIAALRRDGYHGWLSLETHWRGPAGDRLEASRICGRNLVRLVE